MLAEFAQILPDRTVETTIAANKRTLFLEIDDLQPADQFSVRYSINAADGAELRSEIIGTIHKLGANAKLAAK